jgi:hypothetical protein
MIIGDSELGIIVRKECVKEIDGVPVDCFNSLSIDFELGLLNNHRSEAIGVFPRSRGIFILAKAGGNQELCLGIEPMTESYLQCGTEEEVSCD